MSKSEIESAERNVKWSYRLRNSLRAAAGLCIAGALGLGVVSEFNIGSAQVELALAVASGIGALALAGASKLAAEDYSLSQEILTVTQNSYDVPEQVEGV